MCVHVADGSRVEVGGSLGGVGVVSLCEGGGLHTRVLSAGQARAHDTHAAQDTRAHDGDDAKALLFTIHRKVASRSDDEAPGKHMFEITHCFETVFNSNWARIMMLICCKL